ncbi:MAG: MBL fold metallo-hydrolase [Gammaproteobacteria bacterium]|jgi:glyoxylase-like metal-dependent hydrolase (beta-lactamase superfamily II)
MSIGLRGYLFAFALSVGLCSIVHAQQRQWGQDRSIRQISPSVYRWGSDGQYGAYILTSDGIIVVDGHYCPSGTVAWLKEELARRHDVPVRFVVLSHDHQDHICHTELFSDTAVTIGHRLILPHIVREQRISAVPEVLFEDEMDLRLGGLEVKLLYVGPSHSDNLIHVHVPQEGVLISIDVARNSLFPDLRDMDVHGMLRGLRRLARLDDVDVVLPGHGTTLLDQSNFMRTHDFLQTLHDRVLDEMIAGHSLPEIRERVRMDEFSDLGGLARYLDVNIVTMYDYLYRYREPNNRITELEAVSCIEDSSDCRTSD